MTTTIDNTTATYYRTERTNAKPGRVDPKAHVIHGAKVIETGDLNDSRPWTVDTATLEQVVDFGNRPNKGLKARFAHPNMSDDGLGTFVGHWRNLHIGPTEEGEAVFGDLHLARSAFNTPKGDLATYLMDLAEESPEAFGVSIATMLAEEMDKEPTDGQRIPLRIAALHAADFVDEPSATRGGLFTINWSDPKDLAPMLDHVIDRHFRDLTPEQCLAKAHRYLERHFGRSIDMAIAIRRAGQRLATEPTPETPPAADLEMLVCPNCGTEFERPAAEEGADPAEPQMVTCPNCGTTFPADPPPVDQPPAEDPAPDAATEPATPDLAAASLPYREAFGEEQGSRWFALGLSFDQAAQLHRKAQADELAQLRSELAQTREQLSALMGAAGPVPVGRPNGANDGEPKSTLRSHIRRGDA